MARERWVDLYALSLRLGGRYLVRHGYLREAVIRLLVPMDPGRYVELPWARAVLDARPGEQILDVGSPKLLAVALADSGVEVASVDAYDAEIARWRKLAKGRERLRLDVADGRALPFADEAFDHAYSVSAIEHVDTDGGDAEVLAEMARCVRPGGRILFTVPFATKPYDEYRPRPLYGEQREHEQGFLYARHYDEARIEALAASVPRLHLLTVDVAGLRPDLATLYDRTFPLLVPFGLLFGVLSWRRRNGGTIVRVALERV